MIQVCTTLVLLSKCKLFINNITNKIHYKKNMQNIILPHVNHTSGLFHTANICIHYDMILMEIAALCVEGWLYKQLTLKSTSATINARMVWRMVQRIYTEIHSAHFSETRPTCGYFRHETKFTVINRSFWPIQVLHELPENIIWYLHPYICRRVRNDLLLYC